MLQVVVGVPSSGGGHRRWPGPSDPGGGRHGLDMDKLCKEMEDKLNESPRILQKTAGEESCCIFRIPQSLVDVNKKDYYPRIVSIGPYHHGRDDLRMIEEHKPRYLKGVLHRMERNGNPEALRMFLDAVAEKVPNIKKSYSEELDGKFDTEALVKMMVLDGIFIIELLCRVGNVVSTESNDPLFNMEWVLPFLHRDLMVLENQMPFFVLQILFDKSALSRTTDQTLDKLALRFFNQAVQRPNEMLEGFPALKGVHLLDLLRLSFTIPLRKENDGRTSSSLQLSPSASKLRGLGIRVKEGKTTESFLDIKYKHNVLWIPRVTIDAMARAFLLNAVAFEVCYDHCSKHMKDYAIFMASLVNTPHDAEILCDRQVMENYTGFHNEVAELFNNMNKDLSIDLERSYLSDVYIEVNKRLRVRRWWGWMMDLWDKHFHSPWSFISLCGAISLLALTAAQVYYAANPPKNKPPSP